MLALGLSVVLSVLWLASFAAARQLGALAPMHGAVAGGLAVLLLLRDSGLRARLKPTALGAGVGVLVGLFSAAASQLVLPLLSEAFEIDGELRTMRALFSGPSVIATAAALAAIVLCEEILWRGVALQALRAQLGDTAALVLSALLYAAAQAGSGSGVLVVTAMLAGTAWGVLALATGGLFAPLVAHALFTFAGVFFGPF